MNASITDKIRAQERGLARKYIWYEEPDSLIARSGGLLDLRCQILSMGSLDDFTLAISLWGRPAMEQALDNARAGQIDEKSWHYWHLVFQRDPAPPPVRQIFKIRNGA